MTSIFRTVLLLVAVAASAAVPRVSQVRLEQDGRHRARVSYELTEAPGIVTFDILTNGVSIGASVLTNAVGDVNRLVQPGSRTIVWTPWETWPGHKFTTACVAAKVTVWPTNAPPDYLAVDLTKTNCPVTYHVSQEALPWGKIWTNQKYKGDVLLMKRIHASHVLSFMGSPESEANRTTDGRETRRMCTLTNDFYIGVYPMTFRQYFLIQYGPEYTREDHKETFLSPVNQLSYNQLRYNTENARTLIDGLPPVNFPTHARTFIGRTSLLKGWRDKTGLTLDLPTSAQWEYACRAGSTTPIYTHPTASSGQMSDLGAIANRGNQEVGRLAGNAFDLFDMLGNVFEWCMDYYEQDLSAEAVTDPLGPVSAPDLRRKIRGYHTQQIHWRSAFLTGSDYTTTVDTMGFRLCITLP